MSPAPTISGRVNATSSATRNPVVRRVFRLAEAPLAPDASPTDAARQAGTLPKMRAVKTLMPLAKTTTVVSTEISSRRGSPAGLSRSNGRIAKTASIRPNPERTEQQALDEALENEAVASSTEGTANPQLVLATTRAREQHVGNVRTCDEKKERDRRHENLKRSIRVPDDPLAQRCDPVAHLLVCLGIGELEPSSNRCELGLRLRERNAAREPSHDSHPMRSTEAGLCF